MERGTTPQIARDLMKDHVLGTVEAASLLSRLSVSGIMVEPMVPYEASVLKRLAETHLLVLGQELTIRQLRTTFGCDPEVSEPCFYNQDWYLDQKFMDESLPPSWFLLQKEVVEATRAIQPADILASGIQLPKAVQCTYAFFAYYFATGGKKLWEYDFVWCCDTDHNGDRIYVGKYTDIDGINKSGFSIHRHLSLRSCYGAVSIF